MALLVIKIIFVASLVILLAQIGHRVLYPEQWGEGGSSSGKKHLAVIDHGPKFDKGFEAWIAAEEGVALEGLLANIAPGGRFTNGTREGTVLASPSKIHPDYFYQWTRDSAITIGSLVRLSVSSPKRYGTILSSYVMLQKHLQRLSNPSGTFSDLSGLGEPKFLADGSSFANDWGRPQHDGPALRALTTMAYLRAYNASHPQLWKSTQPPGRAGFFTALYAPTLPAESVIKADLEYIARYWMSPGFDLWEEVDGLHLFTAMVQRKALKEGAELAGIFDDDGAQKWYEKQEQVLTRLVKTFWNPFEQRLVATLGSGRSGFDCGNLLGALHGGFEEDGVELFGPASDEVLMGLLDLVDDQRARFRINHPFAETEEEKTVAPKVWKAAAIGRYPEDKYDGDGITVGNPWFLCTAAAGEILYRAAAEVDGSSLQQNISTLRRKVITTFNPSIDDSDGEYDPDDVYWSFVNAGDQFLRIIQIYSGPNGSMAEQIDGDKGYQRGARDLTWSYGAFLDTANARKELKKSKACLKRKSGNKGLRKRQYKDCVSWKRS
jgi:glucoamylase